MDHEGKGSNKGPLVSKGKGGGAGKGGKGGRGKGKKANGNFNEQGTCQGHSPQAIAVTAEGVSPPKDAVPARKRGRGNTAGAADRKAEQEAKLKAAMDKLVRDGNSQAASGAGFDFTSVSEVRSVPSSALCFASFMCSSHLLPFRD